MTVTGGCPPGPVTEGPSTSEGIEWTGRRWRRRLLMWRSGAWVPATEPAGEFVNNATSLERLSSIGRTLVVLPVLALILCVSAAGLEALKPPSENAEPFEPSNYDRAAQLSLLLAAALVAVFAMLAVVRLVRHASKAH